MRTATRPLPRPCRGQKYASSTNRVTNSTSCGHVPDIEEVVLQQRASMRIQRSERLVHTAAPRDDGKRPRQRPRLLMPPDRSRIKNSRKTLRPTISNQKCALATSARHRSERRLAGPTYVAQASLHGKSANPETPGAATDRDGVITRLSRLLALRRIDESRPRYRAAGLRQRRGRESKTKEHSLDTKRNIRQCEVALPCGV